MCGTDALRPILAAVLLVVATAMTGCASKEVYSDGWMLQGDLGHARDYFHDHLTQKKDDRRYLLDRVRLAVLTMADGYPGAAQPYFETAYDILRTQGVNADKTVQSVVLTEGVKFWKGEPFEQALAMSYYGIQQSMLGHWDNARAASGNSLFQLRDFGKNANGQRINTYEIAQRALEYERGAAGKPAGTDYIDHGYVVRESNFTLGYILGGIANQQLQRPEEASDHFLAAVQFNPAIQPLTQELRSGKYNTILVVGWGLGPRKVEYGPDGSLARFDPRTPSDPQPLLVTVGGATRTYQVVTDVNAMAVDHMWNNMEDVRTAKSFLGNALLTGGLIATGVGSGTHSNEAVYAGLGAAAMGILLKATAHADTTYCDAFPQRFYVVPLQLDSPDTVVTLEVQGSPVSRLALTGVVPPRGDPSARGARLRYVHLLGGGYMDGSTSPPWASSGRVFYDSDTGAINASAAGPVPLSPYILGGNSVRPPDDTAVTAYRSSGGLVGVTPDELAGFYRGEGITWDTRGGDGWAGLHVLEGGKSLVAPMGGTLGFVRLFGQSHPPYVLVSKPVRDFIDSLKSPVAPRPQSSPPATQTNR